MRTYDIALMQGVATKPGHPLLRTAPTGRVIIHTITYHIVICFQTPTLMFLIVGRRHVQLHYSSGDTVNSNNSTQECSRQSYVNSALRDLNLPEDSRAVLRGHHPNVVSV